MNYSGLVLASMIFLFVAMSMSVASMATECGVNVYGLEVDDGEIVGYAQNTGDFIELINYSIYVNNVAVSTGSFGLSPDTSRRIEHSYNFGHGEYDIELRADIACGDSDSETIIHNILETYMCNNPSAFDGQDYCDYTHTRYLVCDDGNWVVEDVNSGEYCYNCNACGDDVCNCGETSDSCWSDCGNICNPGYINTYRCNGVWRQRLYKDHNCDYDWRNIERCSDECVDGYCVDNGNNGGNSGNGECGVRIDGIDYINHISSSSTAWVEFTIKNTGDEREDFETRLYIDGSYWGSKEVELNSGSRATRKFNFHLGVGSHDIELKAVADCGSRDTKRLTIVVQRSNIFPQSCNYNSVCEYGESYSTCPHDCPLPDPDSGYTTSVDVHPNSLDVEMFATGVVSIDITSSRDQIFTIIVSGTDENWVSYPDSVDVGTGKKMVYLYITPDESGTHSLEVTVSADGENLDFSETVNFYVSPSQDGTSSGLAGYIAATPTGLAAIAITILIVAAIVIYVFYKRVRPDNEYKPEWAKAF
jgi:hypothetical protein